MKKKKSKKVIKKYKKGFTLVELLCVIVILGVIATMTIASVGNLISKSKDEKNNQNERTVSMAAESYLLANKSERPNSIGEVKRIALKDLKNANYLTSDIFNTKNEKCMDKSYVRVYKYSRTGYTYTPYIYCGNEEPPETEEVPSPSLKVEFTDLYGKDIKDASTNVSIARVLIHLDGGVNSTGEALAIDGYNYVISAKYKNKDGSYDSELREVFNSGTLSGNMENQITITEDLKDYVDITKETYFNVKATVRNQAGGEVTSIVDSLENGESAIYDDVTAPICTDIREEAPENEWITSENEYRTISVTCNDDADNQSGCVRTNYTKTWPNKNEPEAEYAWITVKDNAGNENIQSCKHGESGCCMVRVNVDWNSPTIKVNGVYKANAEGKPADNVNLLKKSSNSTSDGWSGNSRLIADSKDANAYIIKETDYNGTTNDWFNGNYPYGVVYAVELSDNLNLKGYSWFTNEALSKSEDVEKNNIGIGPESKIDNSMFLEKGKSQTIYAWFKEDGIRHGTLRAYDKAGNVTEVKVSAKLDKVAPQAINPKVTSDMAVTKVKTSSNKYADGVGQAYTLGTWSNCYLQATYRKVSDNINSKNLELSGLDYVQSIVKNQANTAVQNVKTNTVNFNTDSIEGMNTISVRTCDVAGNCTAYSDTADLWVDTKAPTCNTSKQCQGSGCNNDKEWYGLNDGPILVKGTCKETGTYGSGCVQDISYTFDLNVTNLKKKVGPGAGGGEGIVMDNAGNKATCEANVDLKIDRVKPTCITQENNSWTKDNKKIYYKCKDESGGSGCSGSLSDDNDSPSIRGYEKTWKTTKDTVRVKKFIATDNAGNTTECSAKTLSVKVDKTAPEIETKSLNKNNRKVTATGSDKGSGVKNYRYMFKTVDSAPSATASGWGTSKTGPSNCGNTYTAYVKVTDKVGHTKVVKIGSYTTASCCGPDNPTGCEWKTSCREGNTKIYTSAGANLEAGYVQHHLAGASDILYIIGETASMYEVVPASVARKYSYFPSNNRVWIYKNCVGGSNSVCPYSTCPG